MANILGISCYFHDSAAALVSGNELVAASAEERFSLRKHDAAYPQQAIDFVLAQAGIRAQALDHVVFYERPHVALSRALCLLLVGLPRNAAQVGRKLQAWFGKRLWIRTQLAAHLGIPPARISFCPHHVAHASHAFLLSPYSSAAVMTLDGVGEWSSGGLFDAKRGQPLRTLRELELAESLGLMFASVTRLLGLKPNADECSTMALAGFADNADGGLSSMVRQHLDARHLNLSFDDDRAFTGPLRTYLSRVKPGALSCLDARASRPSSLDDSTRSAVSLAAAMQSNLEQSVMALANELRLASGQQTLCIAGGVANNSAMITKLAHQAGFTDVFVPLDPGDAGAAVGAAAWLAANTGSPDLRGAPAYLGKEIAERFCGETVQLWKATVGQVGSGVRVFEHADISDAADLCVDELSKGRIVAWAQGRAEFGPRALGNRSILMLPDLVDLADRLASEVKLRPRFRPFALSILQEDAEAVLEMHDALTQPYRWMQATARVRPQAVERVRAAMHVDGTTRPQVVCASDGSWLYELLRRIKQRTGLGALLNTSMNIAGMPLVNDETEALLFFRMTRVDLLVCGNISAMRL